MGIIWVALMYPDYRRIGTLTTLGQKLYAEAGAVAEQSISSIRTVTAFTGEMVEAARYRIKLEDAEKVRYGPRILY